MFLEINERMCYREFLEVPFLHHMRRQIMEFFKRQFYTAKNLLS